MNDDQSMPGEPTYSHSLFTSLEDLATFTGDKLRNNEPFYGDEGMAAIHLIALNLSHYMDELANLRNEFRNLAGGGEVAQWMMDDVEKHREQYLAVKRMRESQAAASGNVTK
ncbi:MAG: hypothetical protein ACYC96_16615 [Fimbriimonadaceae bacterium]